MTYAIAGLPAERFAPFFEMDDAELASHRAQRVSATTFPGFPCRVSLCDAEVGEELLLIHHVNHAVETPYRNAFAIYVRKLAAQAARFVDEVPPVLRDRPIALRGYTAEGQLCDASLAIAGDADEALLSMFNNRSIVYIDAHNAAHGCFAARAVRHD